MIKKIESANICKLLSYELRTALVKAAQVPGVHGELQKRKAIEEATARARAYQPRAFK